VTGIAFYLILVVFALPGILLGFTVHEYCHARVATAYGDPLPRRQGRLSLNPAAQVHPVGLVMLLLIGFGFARPVQFNPLIVRRGTQQALVAAAGPLSNLAIATVLGLALRLLMAVDPSSTFCGIPSFADTPSGALFWVLTEGFFINVILCVFNLLPIPPLDGYRVVEGLLGGHLPRLFAWVDRNQSAIWIAALVLVFVVPQLTQGSVSPISSLISGLYGGMARPLVGTTLPGLFPTYQYLTTPGLVPSSLLTAPCAA